MSLVVREEIAGYNEKMKPQLRCGAGCWEEVL